MNDDQTNHIDAVIDRAARQLVERDPAVHIYAAVCSEIRALGERRTARWLQWSLVALPSAAALLLALIVFTQREPQPVPIVRGPVTLVAEMPAPIVSSDERISAPSGDPEQRRLPVVSADSIPASWPGEPPPPIEVARIQFESVQVRTIAPGALVVPAIRISEIDIEAR